MAHYVFRTDHHTPSGDYGTDLSLVCQPAEQIKEGPAYLLLSSQCTVCVCCGIYSKIYVHAVPGIYQRISAFY